MPKQERHKTPYPGVYFILGNRGKDDQIFYIQYRNPTGKMIEEKVGRKIQGWSAAKANKERADRLNGRRPSNKDRREAIEAAKKMEAGKMNISRIWDLYRENQEGLKSQAADKSRFTNYLKPVFGSKEPQEILPLDIDRLRRKTLSGKSDQTIKHVLALLRRIVRYGVRKQISQGLTFVLEMPTVDNEVVETLSKDELSSLLKTLNNSDDIQISHLMFLALYTGMRKGELLSLRWSDINLEDSFIKIRAPKGGKRMSIPINGPAHDILKDHPHLSEYVFTNRFGEPFREIRKRIETIRKTACLPSGFRPLHGLRHVYASMLASSGQVDIYVLQRLLTHKSPAMTQRYSHLRDQALRKASDLAGQLFKAAEKGSDDERIAER
jgi:integrase